MNLATLAVKNIRRNRLRTVLTVLGVAVAILSFVLLRTVLDAWNTGAEHAAQDRLATWHKVTFVMPLPKRYFEEVRQVPGVKKATYLNWFGAKHPTRDREFFANLAVDPETFFDVYDDMVVPPAELAAWKQDRQGAIIGASLAKQFGWKVGDEVTLAGSIYPGDWKFRISGIYTAARRSVDQAQFLFHWDYMNESLPAGRKDQIGWITTSIEDVGRGPTIGTAIDKAFEEREIQTQTMSERALNSQFLGAASAILTALDIVSIVILVIMMLILGNTIAMGVRERTREYGVLLALGFRPGHIVSFVIGESLTVGFLGGVVGLGLSYPIVQQGMGRWLEENMGSWFPYFRIPALVSLGAIGIAVMLGLVAALIPAWRASKLDAVEALRRLG
ncbi:MAG: ABC transporter permease [Polyangiaceae bacterium]|nr:ABC transporter permease [Polyangiaceae bacterium]MBK8994689.1 ABC transporter permease [Myxococcales bacterium]MCE7889489.1 ABC transporter permease [Sorangiineae bacterium PRO1]MCL4750898.1 FtsX-like permease family protein [Myxococcales bacterium]